MVENKRGRGRPAKTPNKEIKKKEKPATKVVEETFEPIAKISEVKAGVLKNVKDFNTANLESITSEISFNLEDLNDEIGLHRKNLKTQEFDHKNLKEGLKRLTKRHSKIKTKLRSNRDLLTKKIDKYEKCSQDQRPSSSGVIRWALKFFFHFDNRIDLKGDIARIEETIKISDQVLIETTRELTESLIQFKLTNELLKQTEQKFDKLQWHRQQFQKIISRTIDDENSFDTAQKQTALYNEFLSTEKQLSEQRVEPNINVDLERIIDEVHGLLKSENKINFNEINKLTFTDVQY